MQLPGLRKLRNHGMIKGTEAMRMTMLNKRRPRPEDYDRVDASETDEDAGYEPVYRDGSTKNECWHDDA